MNWVKLDGNKRFLTFESGTMHDEDENWYKVPDNLVPKILLFKYNCQFVFDENNKIIDVTGEKYIPPEPEPMPPEPTTEEYLIDLDFRLSMIELGLV